MLNTTPEQKLWLFERWVDSNLNASDSRNHQICLWLASLLNAENTLKQKSISRAQIITHWIVCKKVIAINTALTEGAFDFVEPGLPFDALIFSHFASQVNASWFKDALINK